MKTILVPTDFSSYAQNALDFACQIALGNDVEIILLNTYELRFVDAGFFIDFDDSLKTLSLEKLQTLFENTIKQYPTLTGRLKTQSELGQLVNVLQKLESSDKPDLIVMGTKGRTGWDEVLIGSETARIITNSNIPVLVIPDECKYHKQDSLAFSVGLNEKLSQSEVNLAQLLIKEDAKVHLFHNYDEALEIEVGEEHDLYNRFMDYFPNTILDLTLDVKGNDIEAIKDYLQNVNPGAIVVRAKHRSLLRSLFHKSVSEALSYSVTQPLLVLKG